MDPSQPSLSSCASPKNNSPRKPSNQRFTDFSSKVNFLRKLQLKGKSTQPQVLLPRLETHLTKAFIRELETCGSLNVLSTTCKPSPKRKKLQLQFVRPETKNSIKNQIKLLSPEVTNLKNNAKNKEPIGMLPDISVSTIKSINTISSTNSDTDCNTTTSACENWNNKKKPNISKAIPDLIPVDKYSLVIKSINQNSIKPTNTLCLTNTQKALSNHLTSEAVFNNNNNCHTNTNYNTIDKSESSRDVMDDNESSISQNIGCSNNNDECSSVISNNDGSPNYNCSKLSAALINNISNSLAHNEKYELKKRTNEIENHDSELSSSKEAENEHECEETEMDSKFITLLSTQISRHNAAETENLPQISGQSVYPRVHKESELENCLSEAELVCEGDALLSNTHKTSHLESCFYFNEANAPDNKEIIGSVIAEAKEKVAMESESKVCLEEKNRDFVCRKTEITANKGVIPKIILYVKGRGVDKEYTCSRNMTGKKEKELKKIQSGSESTPKCSSETIFRSDKEKARKNLSDNDNNKKKRHKSLTEGEKNRAISKEFNSRLDLKCTKTLHKKRIKENNKDNLDDSNDSFSDSLPDLRPNPQINKSWQERCDVLMKGASLMQNDSREAVENGQAVTPFSKTSPNHKTSGDSATSIESSTTEGSRRVSSRKGKGFYNEDIPFPLDSDEIEDFPLATHTTLSPECIEEGDQCPNHDSRHEKNTSKGLSHCDYYHLLYELNMCTCSQPSKCECSKKSLAGNYRLNIQSKREDSAQIKRYSNATKKNGLYKNTYNARLAKRKGETQSLTRKFPNPNHTSEYSSANHLCESLKNGVANKKTLTFRAVEPPFNEKSCELAELQHPPPRQRTRSLSIDSALSLFKVRYDGPSLMFPLHRSSSLTNLATYNNFLPNNLLDCNKISEESMRLILSPPSVKICEIPDFSISQIETATNEDEDSSHRNHIKSNNSGKYSINSDTKNGDPKIMINKAQVQDVSSRSLSKNVSETSNNPQVEREDKNKASEIRLKKKANTKLKNRRRPDGSKKHNDSSSHDHKTAKAALRPKHNRKKKTSSKKGTGDEFKEALEDQIQKFHELEKGKRLAQEIPGFNWLEEKIRKASSCSSPPKAIGTKAGYVKNEIFAPAKLMGRSYSQSSTSENYAEMGDSQNLKHLPELILNAKCNETESKPNPDDVTPFSTGSSFLEKQVSKLPALLAVPPKTPVTIEEMRVDHSNLVSLSSSEASGVGTLSHSLEAQSTHLTSTSTSEKKERLSFHEEMNRNSSNKPFNHLQTAVTAMPPTSRALPKRPIPLPTSSKSLSPSVISVNFSVNQINHTTQPSVLSCQSSVLTNTIVSTDPTTTIFTSNIVQPNISTLPFSPNSSTGSQFLHVSSYPTPSKSSTSTKTSSTFLLQNSTPISSLSSSYASLCNTTTLPQKISTSDKIPNNIDVKMTHSTRFQPSAATVTSTQCNKSYNKVISGLENDLVNSESNLSVAIVSYGKLPSSSTSSSGISLSSFPSSSQNFSLPFSSMSQSVTNTFHLNVVEPPLSTVKNSQSENILTNTNSLVMAKDNQNDHSKYYDSPHFSSVRHSPAVTEENVNPDSLSNSLIGSTTPSSPSPSRTLALPPPLRISTATSPPKGEEDDIKKDSSHDIQISLPFPVQCQLEERNPADNLENKESTQAGQKCRSPKSPFSPKLSILKEAFKTRLSVLSDDTDSPSVKKGDKLDPDKEKPTEESNSSRKSTQIESKDLNKLDSSHRERGEQSSAASVGGVLPSIESVLPSLSLNDQILWKESQKESETPSLIVALYEELLRTRQEVEKLRKIQEQMLKSDTIKKPNASQSTPATVSVEPEKLPSRQNSPSINTNQEKTVPTPVRAPVIDITKDEEPLQSCRLQNISTSSTEKQQSTIAFPRPMDGLGRANTDIDGPETENMNEKSNKRSSSHEVLTLDEFRHPYKRSRQNNESTHHSEPNNQFMPDVKKDLSSQNHSRLRDLLGISNSELDIVPLEENPSLRTFLNYSPNTSKSNFTVLSSSRGKVDTNTQKNQYLQKSSLISTPKDHFSPNENTSIIPTNMPQLVCSNQKIPVERRAGETHKDFFQDSNPKSSIPMAGTNSTEKSSHPINNNLSHPPSALDTTRVAVCSNNVAEESKTEKHNPSLMHHFNSNQRYYQEEELKQPQSKQQEHPQKNLTFNNTMHLPHNQLQINQEPLRNPQISPKSLRKNEEEKNLFIPQYTNRQRDLENKDQSIFTESNCKAMPTSSQRFRPKIIIPPCDKELVATCVPDASNKPPSAFEWPRGHQSTSQQSFANITQVSPSMIGPVSHSYSTFATRPSAFGPSQYHMSRQYNHKNRFPDSIPPAPGYPAPISIQQKLPSFQLIQQPQSQKQHMPPPQHQPERYIIQDTKQTENINNSNSQPLPSEIPVSVSHFYPSQHPYKKGIPPNHPIAYLKHPPQPQSISQVVHHPYPLSQPTAPHNIPTQRTGIQIAENLQQVGSYDDQANSKNPSNRIHVISGIPYRPNNHVPFSPSYSSKPYQMVRESQIPHTQNKSPTNTTALSAHLEGLSYQNRIPISHSSTHLPMNESQATSIMQMHPTSSNKTAVMNTHKIMPQSEGSPLKRKTPPEFQHKQLYAVDEIHPRKQSPINQQVRMTTAYHPRHFESGSEINRFNQESSGAASISSIPENKNKCLVCPHSAQFLCSGCKTAWYCSKDCQRQHWKEHSPNCGSRKQL